ncbi:hypothetical protein Mapa_003965 [Marchantia paleacea]|nr:hypothetical protein Mapa_003965 [Marchantia paleacea]
MAMWTSAAFRSLSDMSRPSLSFGPDMTDRKPGSSRKQHGIAQASLRKPVKSASTECKLELKLLTDHFRSGFTKRRMSAAEAAMTWEGILRERCRTESGPGAAAGREEKLRHGFRTKSLAAHHQRGGGSEDEDPSLERLKVDGDAVIRDWERYEDAKYDSTNPCKAARSKNWKTKANGDCRTHGSEKEGAHGNGAAHLNHSNGAHNEGAASTNHHHNGHAAAELNASDTPAAEPERAHHDLTKDDGNGHGSETTKVSSNGSAAASHNHMHSNGSATIDRPEAKAADREPAASETRLHEASAVDAVGAAASTPTPTPTLVVQLQELHKVYEEAPTEVQTTASLSRPSAPPAQLKKTQGTSAKSKRAQLKPAPSEEELYQQYIYVKKFLKDKDLLYFGVTGFLCKVAAERTLDVQPDVGTIYVIVKAKTREDAQIRLEKEIISSPIFEKLKQKYGEERFLEFMRRKVIAIKGDIMEKDLALHPDDAAMLMERIDVIVNSAATTKFDERYDHALRLNTFGPQNILELAKKCSKRPMLIHISTAYVNGKRRGLSKEEPFEFGQTLVSETGFPDEKSPSESNPIFKLRKWILSKLTDPYWPTKTDKEKAAKRKLVRESMTEFMREVGAETSTLDPEKELELAMECCKGCKPEEEKLRMEELGHMRANEFGWQDAYVFTKAMGEMMLMKYKEDVPIVIIRPSVVESTWKNPFDGWIEGNRMLDPIVMHYGKGDLSGFRVDPNVTLDIIPADIVANVILAVMAKHGGYEQMYPFVYQVASSAINPLTMREIADVAYDHFTEFPMLQRKVKKEKEDEEDEEEENANEEGEEKLKELKYSRMTFITNDSDFQALLFFRYGLAMQLMEHLLTLLQHPRVITLLERRWVKKYLRPVVKRVIKVRSGLPSRIKLVRFILNTIKHMAEVYKPYVFYKGRFDATNSEKILTQIAPEEGDMFSYSVSEINWRKYLLDSHFVGLRQHVNKWLRCRKISRDWTIVQPPPNPEWIDRPRRRKWEGLLLCWWRDFCRRLHIS